MSLRKSQKCCQFSLATKCMFLQIQFVLRTVPTIVTAHMFCASRDPRASYGWCLLKHGYFCALKLCGESRTQQVILMSKKKSWGNHTFFRYNNASIWKKATYIALYFTGFLNYCCLIISEKCLVTPNFLFGFQ